MNLPVLIAALAFALAACDAKPPKPKVGEAPMEQTRPEARK